MRFADARCAASIMISCSMIASLIDISDVPACVCMMNTSLPRTDSPNRRSHLAVREVLDVRVAELDAEVLGDLLGERQVCAARSRGRTASW